MSLTNFLGADQPRGVGGLTVRDRFISPVDRFSRSGSDGIDGRRGADGADGPTGAVGPTGPQGIQGETGPAGPPGETGPAGEAGPAGPAGPAGETGPAGNEGPQGPPGPKGDSIVQNRFGTRAVGITEGTQGQWFDLLPADAPLDAWFEECLANHFRFRSTCGRMDLVVGVPKHCVNWRIPEKSETQRKKAARLWKHISSGTLLDLIET